MYLNGLFNLTETDEKLCREILEKYKDISIYNIAEDVQTQNSLSRKIYTGKLLKEYEYLSELELALICHRTFYHFGGSSYIYQNKRFSVEINVD